MLPFPDGYNEGLASAVSGSGKKIVGQLTNGSVSRAATWLDTKPKLLKAPMGIGSDARCISLDGSVIGGSISRAEFDAWQAQRGDRLAPSQASQSVNQGLVFRESQLSVQNWQ